jgi:hypothetical protein
MAKKSRRERFETVGGNRVNIILKTLSNLASCANRNNYEYSEADVRKMFKAIKDKVALVEKQFAAELDRQKSMEFKFSDHENHK